MAKRMRFGLVFRYGEKVGDDLLRKLQVKKAEGCEKDGQKFIMITTTKPQRTDNIMKWIADFNQEKQEKIVCVGYAGGAEVAVFDKGNAFREHPIYRVIDEMRMDASYWSWYACAEGNKKRALCELESDLVDASITPHSTKRVAVEKVVDPMPPKKMSKSARPSKLPHGLREEVLVHMLVKEVTRSKDETIQAKNEMIELLLARKSA